MLSTTSYFIQKIDSKRKKKHNKKHRCDSSSEGSERSSDESSPDSRSRHSRRSRQSSKSRDKSKTLTHSQGRDRRQQSSSDEDTKSRRHGRSYDKRISSSDEEVRTRKPGRNHEKQRSSSDEDRKYRKHDRNHDKRKSSSDEDTRIRKHDRRHEKRNPSSYDEAKVYKTGNYRPSSQGQLVQEPCIDEKIEILPSMRKPRPHPHTHIPKQYTTDDSEASSFGTMRRKQRQNRSQHKYDLSKTEKPIVESAREIPRPGRNIVVPRIETVTSVRERLPNNDTSSDFHDDTSLTSVDNYLDSALDINGENALNKHDRTRKSKHKKHRKKNSEKEDSDVDNGRDKIKINLLGIQREISHNEEPYKEFKEKEEYQLATNKAIRQMHLKHDREQNHQLSQPSTSKTPGDTHDQSSRSKNILDNNSKNFAAVDQAANSLQRSIGSGNHDSRNSTIKKHHQSSPYISEYWEGISKLNNKKPAVPSKPHLKQQFSRNDRSYQSNPHLSKLKVGIDSFGRQFVLEDMNSLPRFDRANKIYQSNPNLASNNKADFNSPKGSPSLHNKRQHTGYASKQLLNSIALNQRRKYPTNLEKIPHTDQYLQKARSTDDLLNSNSTDKEISHTGQPYFSHSKEIQDQKRSSVQQLPQNVPELLSHRPISSDVNSTNVIPTSMKMSSQLQNQPESINSIQSNGSPYNSLAKSKKVDPILNDMQRIELCSQNPIVSQMAPQPPSYDQHIDSQQKKQYDGQYKNDSQQYRQQQVHHLSNQHKLNTHDLFDLKLTENNRQVPIYKPKQHSEQLRQQFSQQEQRFNQQTDHFHNEHSQFHEQPQQQFQQQPQEQFQRPPQQQFQQQSHQYSRQQHSNDSSLERYDMQSKQSQHQNHQALNEEDLNKISGVHATVSRIEAEEILQSHHDTSPSHTDGAYIIRRSQSLNNELVLSVLVGVEVKHLIISKSQAGNYYLGMVEEESFPRLQQLLDYFKQHPINGVYLLTTPLENINNRASVEVGTTGEQWRIDARQLSLNNELGRGRYGIVYRGVLQGGDNVAVKTVKDQTYAAVGDLQDLRTEIEILKRLRHPRLTRLIGVTSLPGSMTGIIMEYLINGNLLEYLQDVRTWVFTLKDNKKAAFGEQVAEGMAYLESQQVVHRDLAARNVLLSQDMTVKIADFGLAKFLTVDGTIVVESTHRPLRWMALESLLSNEFSVKSDVWAYGILLLEIYTLGEMPYSDLIDEMVISKLEQNYRAPKPACCPDGVYSEIMAQCWRADPATRPSFQSIMYKWNHILNKK